MKTERQLFTNYMYTRLGATSIDNFNEIVSTLSEEDLANYATEFKKIHDSINNSSKVEYLDYLKCGGKMKKQDKKNKKSAKAKKFSLGGKITTEQFFNYFKK